MSPHLFSLSVGPLLFSLYTASFSAKLYHYPQVCLVDIPTCRGHIGGIASSPERGSLSPPAHSRAKATSASSSAMPYDNGATGSFASATPSSTSLSLLQRVKDQHPDAWRRLVRLYRPLVFLWCRQAGLELPRCRGRVRKSGWPWPRASLTFAATGPRIPFVGFGGLRNTNSLTARATRAIGDWGNDSRRMLDQIPDEITDSAEQVASDNDLLTRRPWH